MINGEGLPPPLLSAVPGACGSVTVLSAAELRAELVDAPPADGAERAVPPEEAKVIDIDCT